VIVFSDAKFRKREELSIGCALSGTRIIEDILVRVDPENWHSSKYRQMLLEWTDSLSTRILDPTKHKITLVSMPWPKE
jgi:hypothetical protein